MSPKPEIDKASTAPTVEASSVKNQAINQGINMINSKALTVGTTSVREVDGLYSLNDLHKASGGEENFKPAFFLRNDQAQALVAEIAKGADLHLFLKSTKGRNGGTYACKELVIAYAAWISAAFHLKVIRVFLSVAAPQSEPVQASLDYDHISPAQAQDLKQIVHAIVDAGVQAYGETWKRFQNKFKVNSYLFLHPDQYEAARAYLIAKLPNGYAGDGNSAISQSLHEVMEVVPELGVNLFAKQAMQHAQINAASYMRQWREQQAQGKDCAISAEHVPAEVLAGLVAEQLMQQRWLVGYDYGRGGLLAQPVGNEEFVCNWAQLARGIACGDRQATTAELVDLASACNQQLVQRMGNPALVLAV